MSQLPGVLPDAASSLAPETDRLFLALTAVTAAASVAIFAVLAAFAVRYRRRAADFARAARPRGPSGSLGLELLWSAVPLAVFVAFFVAGARAYLAGLTPPADGPTINVVAKQWMWKLQHPNGRREINRLHVPLGAVVHLRMASEDVIHSFFVPAFRLKRDVVPGGYSYAWFQATRVGTYPLFCAEYCGTEHSRMIGAIDVMEPGDYQRWLAGGPPPTDPVEAGAALFERLRCASCHDGDERRGPPLGELIGRAVTLADGRTVVRDDAYLRAAILDPDGALVAGYEPTMPTYAGQVDEDQTLQLLAYLASRDATEPAENAR